MAREQDEYKAVKTAAKIMAVISLAASLALAAAWVLAFMFGRSPVFRQIGEALGISSLSVMDWFIGCCVWSAAAWAGQGLSRAYKWVLDFLF